MKLFSKENCILCGVETGALNRTKLDNGDILCNNCLKETNLSDGYNINTLKASSLDEIKKRIEYVKEEEKENLERVSNFKATYQVGGYIWFDDDHKWFVLPQGTFNYKIDKCYVFKYEDLLNFEVLEDGTTITKGGLGKAVVGGAIFGLAGAIAGGTSKKTKQVCNKLQIKVTTKNIDRPIIYITLINSETKKSGFIYNQAEKSVQEILSKFQIIVNELEEEKKIKKDSNNAISPTDEIKKYKELLDMGAISEEEFNEKKKELLNL